MNDALERKWKAEADAHNVLRGKVIQMETEVRILVHKGQDAARALNDLDDLRDALEAQRAVMDRAFDLWISEGSAIKHGNLRQNLIKLAHEKPELRQHLVPLLRQADNHEIALSAPMDAGTMKGAKLWASFARQYILGNSQPGTPQRRDLIEKAQKAFGYAAFLFRRNRGLVQFYETTAKQMMGDLVDTMSD